MIFFVLLEKIKFYPENIILFFRRKIVDGLTEKIHGNIILFVYSIKMAFLFATNMILHFRQKKQRWSSFNKINLKMTFPISLEKMIFILEHMIFLLIEKLKIIKKFIFIKSPNDSLHFFSCIAFQWKKLGNLIHRLKLKSFVKLFSWSYSTTKNI